MIQIILTLALFFNFDDATQYKSVTFFVEGYTHTSPTGALLKYNDIDDEIRPTPKNSYFKVFYKDRRLIIGNSITTNEYKIISKNYLLTEDKEREYMLLWLQDEDGGPLYHVLIYNRQYVYFYCVNNNIFANKYYIQSVDKKMD